MVNRLFTPWKTARRGLPAIEMMPLERKTFSFVGEPLDEVLELLDLEWPVEPEAIEAMSS